MGIAENNIERDCSYLVWFLKHFKGFQFNLVNTAEYLYQAVKS